MNSVQCILGISDVTYYQMRTGSQCFHVKGVPTLNLRCPSGQMIKIHQAFYGAPPLNSTCWYEILLETDHLRLHERADVIALKIETHDFCSTLQVQ